MPNAPLTRMNLTVTQLGQWGFNSQVGWLGVNKPYLPTQFVVGQTYDCGLRYSKTGKPYVADVTGMVGQAPVVAVPNAALPGAPQIPGAIPPQVAQPQPVVQPGQPVPVAQPQPVVTQPAPIAQPLTPTPAPSGGANGFTGGNDGARHGNALTNATSLVASMISLLKTEEILPKLAEFYHHNTNILKGD